MKAVVVDLFCGIGGLSYGFKQEGFTVTAGIDSDGSCQYAYESNLDARFLLKDIRKLTGAELNRLFGDASYRVLAGCAPCTPFSSYVRRYKKAKRRDRAKNWALLKEFARLIRLTRPHVVTMENVASVQQHRVFRQFVATLRAEGYAVTFQVVRAHWYGVPQRRRRLVLFGSRLGSTVGFLPATHKDDPVTVRDAIGHLPRLKAGDMCPIDRLHTSRGLSALNLQRLKATGRGGSWRDWSDDLRLKCHKKTKGRSFRSVYGRMTWDSVGSVITTQCLGIGNGRFGHPEQDRAISVREAALLQTFPRKFKFVEPREKIYGVRLARQIGNAVPVRLGRMIARSIKRHLHAVSAEAGN